MGLPSFFLSFRDPVYAVQLVIDVRKGREILMVISLQVGT